MRPHSTDQASCVPHPPELASSAKAASRQRSRPSDGPSTIDEKLNISIETRSKSPPTVPAPVALRRSRLDYRLDTRRQAAHGVSPLFGFGNHFPATR